ncbi:MAG: hypothetical protein ABIJ15_06995 [bacterium]
MKRYLLLSLAVLAATAHASLTTEQVRQIYASAPFEARGIYNEKKNINFSEFARIGEFFAGAVLEKVEKLSSVKISYQPKLRGWTALVFKTIYESASAVPELPAQINSRFKDFGHNLVSAVNSFCAEVLTPGSSFRIAPLCAAALFLISILPIHKIRFKLFIQRE